MIGGPGGSGSSTISKMLARKWYLHRLYGGKIVRKKAGEKELENFSKNEMTKDPKIDKEVDNYLIKMSYQKDLLIESKVFAAIATKKHIPTTLKIWLHADPQTSIKRIFEREGWKYDENRFKEELEKLVQRRKNDAERYKSLYEVDISKPEKYNDIVIDSSKLDVYNTLKVILDKIKMNKNLKAEFPLEYLKY